MRYNITTMKRKVSKVFITSCVILIIEAVLLSILFTFYILDLFNLRSLIERPWIVVISITVVMINIIYLFVVCFYTIKKGNDVDAEITDIIGTDLEEAYLFGKIGFLIVDINGLIIYASELFREIEKDLIGINIFEWEPQLKDFLEKDDIKGTHINKLGGRYSVKYLRAAGIFIFKDDTELEQLKKTSEDSATCLGFINIDNYNEIASVNEDNTDSIVKVKGEISDYAKQNGVLLRALKNDSYMAICSFASLQKMRNDKFSLLDKVRAIETGENLKPTLSIGFASSFPDVNKLNEMASNAMAIAMSRGGDQAVVTKFDSDVEFYGGKTEAVENVNKVKTRVFSDSLMSLISKSSNVLIMGHTDLDMDALGSCLGAKAIADFCEKPAYIIYDQRLAERKTRSAVASMFTREEHQKIFISTKEANDKVKPSTILIVVDVSNPDFVIYKDILNVVDKVVVIDHHRRAERFIDRPVLSYIDTSSSSASELIAEFLKYHTTKKKIELDPKCATIMLSGIFLDSMFFKATTVGLRTFEASMILKEYGADNGKADELLKDEYEEYAFINKIVATKQTPFYGTVYCKDDSGDILEKSTLAKVAQTCMRFKGVNCSFAIGRIAENVVALSARSDGTVNVQVICEKMGGGGHFSSSACLFPNKSIREVEEILKEALSNHLENARHEKIKGE